MVAANVMMERLRLHCRIDYVPKSCAQPLFAVFVANRQLGTLAHFRKVRCRN
jgi:hypothetical protein